MGAKVKPRLKNSQQALLYALFDYFGGPTKVTQKLEKKMKGKVSRQTIFNWAKRGKVPINQVFKVSEALAVAPHALNYSELKAFYTSNPSWGKVVGGLTFLNRQTRDAVLSKRHPQ